MNAPAPLTGRMPVICSSCGQQYAEKPCISAMDGKASHGICAACFPAVEADLQQQLDLLCPPRPLAP